MALLRNAAIGVPARRCGETGTIVDTHGKLKMVHDFKVQKFAQLLGGASWLVRGFVSPEIETHEIEAIVLEGIHDQVDLVTRSAFGDLLFAELKSNAIVMRNGLLVMI